MASFLGSRGGASVRGEERRGAGQRRLWRRLQRPGRRRLERWQRRQICTLSPHPSHSACGSSAAGTVVWKQTSRGPCCNDRICNSLKFDTQYH